jgi:MFS family permease
MAASASMWRNRDFVRYWVGHTVSQLGSEITELALPLVALLQLGASSSEVGVLRAAQFLPFLLLTLPAGVLVDRVRRRPLMVAADLGRAALLALIPLGVALGLLDLPVLAVVAFGVGALTVVFDVCYVSVLPSLIGREQLQSGNAALESSRAFASIAGPGLGGALVSLFKASGAIVVDAVSFLVSAVSLLAIRRPEPRAAPTTERGRAALLVGWRQVTRSPLLRPNTFYTASGNLVGSAFGTVLIVFEVRELGLSGLAIGLVSAIGSVGFLVGATASRRLGQRLGIGPVICLGGILTGLGIGVMAAAPRAFPIPVLVAGQLLLGGIALSNLQTMSLRQAITPDAVLGRVNATVRFLGFGTIPVGAAIGGWLGGTIGFRPTLALCAAGALLTVGFPLFSAVRRLHHTPPQEPLWADPAPHTESGS